MSMLDDAIETIRMGNREEGRRLLEEILETDESNEEVWLWLSSVVDSDEDREVCLENVLALDPDNVVAQKGLEALRSGTFNVQDLMSEAIEQEPISGSTFLDEFRRSADTLDEDEELVMPSTMAKSKGKTTKKKSAGFKLNLRLVLLAVFVLLIILALGGLAVARMLMGGEADDTGAPVVQPGQETPAGGGEPPATDQPPAVETAPPLPTDTPTPTNTPFQLPTPKPTDLPTPTATPVVPPTPG